MVATGLNDGTTTRLSVGLALRECGTVRLVLGTKCLRSKRMLGLWPAVLLGRAAIV